MTTDRPFHGRFALLTAARLAAITLLSVGVMVSPATAQYNPGSTHHAAAHQYIDPSHFNEGTLCQMILDMTNGERARAGLGPVAHHPAAAAAATQHSRDMAARGYFDHKSKGLFRRSSPAQRMASYGYQPRMSAENIAMIPTFNSQMIRTSSDRSRQVVAADYNSYERLAQYAMREWMNSPGHRRNILNGQLTTMGVGVAVGMRGNVPYVYLTQDFGG